ncbi:MAG: hypothetical protein K2K24_05090, partial [Clostridia bacterium]|nr:hypothetical protein [Clostridia bacterium]
MKEKLWLQWLIILKKVCAKLASLVRKFIYTDYYLLLVSAIIFIGWYSKSAKFGFTAAVAITCIALLCADDFLPLTVNFFTPVLLIYSFNFDDYTYLWPLAIPLGICFIIFLVKNGRHDFHFGAMFFPLMAVAYVMLIGGLGFSAKDDFLRALPDFFMLGIGVPIFYMLYK